MACDMPETCKFPSVDSCQKKFLRIARFYNYDQLKKTEEMGEKEEQEEERKEKNEDGRDGGEGGTEGGD